MIRIRRAVASEAKPLIGLYSESGRGKTKSALLLARGYCGSMDRVVMIETESGRGEAYADDPEVGGYQVVSLRESFAPKEYGAAIEEAEKANAEALVIDSASHEWEGVGGVLAMAAANQAEGKKGPLVWQRPKIDHAREFMLRLMQTPVALVIVNMRARYPMFEVTARDVERWDAAGRPGGDKAKPRIGEWARSWELAPKQSEDILYEMMLHGWLDEDHALHVTKYTLDSLRDVFPDGQRITIETGQRLRAWAERKSTPAARIDAEQLAAITQACLDHGVALEKLLTRARVSQLTDIAATDYERAIAWIKRHTMQGAA